MEPATHLKSLQALDMALRMGSLKAAAAVLGITPAAVGQRVSSLERYLGTDLLVRGRSGLRSTPELDAALPDLTTAFTALDRVMGALDVARAGEIHVAADPDWAALWLQPRLAGYAAANADTLVNVNGAGPAPPRPGEPDVAIGRDLPGAETLYDDRMVAVCAGAVRLQMRLEPLDAALAGAPLLEVQRRHGIAILPEWSDWFARFGRHGALPDSSERHATVAALLAVVRKGLGVGFAPLSLCAPDIEAGTVSVVFPDAWLPVGAPYRMRVAPSAGDRPQMRRFLAWLRREAAATAQTLRAA